MKKLLALLLICCLVLAMTAPVSADYFFFKDVNADDFTNALVDYCNHNEVHDMTEWEIELSGYNFKSFNVVKTDTTLDFDYDCKGIYIVFPLIPPLVLPETYIFTGRVHVDKPQDGLKKPYTLDITNEDRNVRATGENWKLYMWNTLMTRFKA